MKNFGNKIPGFTAPMLARETDDAFDDADWIFEIKWDGYRAIAEIDPSKPDNGVKLYSRNGLSFIDKFKPIASALKMMKKAMVLDGEVVVLDSEGVSHFQMLQDYLDNPTYPLYYYVFDILNLQGKDLTQLPLIERKEILSKALPGNDLIRYSDHVSEKGNDFFRISGERKLEGIMAKLKDSVYVPGLRTSNWLKIKHHNSEEAIIAGFTQPQGARKFIGALVLGVYENQKLKYIGHTGTGFTEKKLREVYDLLIPLKQERSPFAERVKTNQPVTWVKPAWVCEIKHAGRTKEGHLRQPVFMGLRPDKSIKDVHMETAKIISTPKSIPEKKAGKDEKILAFGKVKVKTTHVSKIYWPKEKITKGDVINYYQSISNYILPYLKDRPQSLKRNPNGINDTGFYHKDAGDAAPEWVESLEIFSESTSRQIDYILCNNAATLAYLNNLGCIELNPWHSTKNALDKPDYLMLDLDPSPKNTPDQVIETALGIKQVLDKAGVEAYIKTSGASGLHIFVPTAKKYSYDQVRDFAQIVCTLAHNIVPDFTSMERNLKKRGNMIYLDYLQNSRGQTIASVYSLRPYQGASVSTPLEWSEVKKGLVFGDFNIHNLKERLEKKGDLFKAVLGKGIDIRKCLKNLGG